MQAGKLRSRLLFNRKVKTQNGFGEDVAGAPTALGTFSAEVRPLTGRELEVMQQRFAEASFSVAMRAQPGITFRREDYITWGTRTLNILDVEDVDQRGIELRLTCREIVQ